MKIEIENLKKKKKNECPDIGMTSRTRFWSILKVIRILAESFRSLQNIRKNFETSNKMITIFMALRIFRNLKKKLLKQIYITLNHFLYPMKALIKYQNTYFSRLEIQN